MKKSISISVAPEDGEQSVEPNATIRCIAGIRRKSAIICAALGDRSWPVSALGLSMHGPTYGRQRRLATLNSPSTQSDLYGCFQVRMRHSIFSTQGKAASRPFLPLQEGWLRWFPTKGLEVSCPLPQPVELIHSKLGVNPP